MIIDRRWNKRLTIAFAIIVFLILIGVVVYRQFETVEIMELQPDVITEINFQTSTSIESKSNERHASGPVDIECVDYANESYTEIVVVQCRQHTIEISMCDDILCVKFEQSLPNYVLMWFNDTLTSTVLEYEMSAEDVSCMVLTQQINYIPDLTDDTTYTFCIFENTTTTVSPFDCVAYYLPPNDYTNSDTEISPVWFSNDDKMSVTLFGIGAFIIFLWLGIMLGVWLIRRYPNLLKGAKNVIIVNSEGNLKANNSIRRRSVQLSVEDNNSIVYRRCMDRRRYSTSNAKDYEIALNPSRFDIIKSRLESSQYEEKYYLEGVPSIAPPEPPKYASSVPSDENNEQKTVDDQLECKRHSDEDLNLDVIYSKCGKIKN